MLLFKQHYKTRFVNPPDSKNVLLYPRQRKKKTLSRHLETFDNVRLTSTMLHFDNNTNCDILYYAKKFISVVSAKCA